MGVTGIPTPRSSGDLTVPSGRPGADVTPEASARNRVDVRIHRRLNGSEFRGAHLGDLVVRELEDHFLWNAPASIRGEMWALVALLGRGLTTKVTAVDRGAELLHFRTGVSAHLMAIEHTVRRSAGVIGKCRVVGPGGEIERSEPQSRLNFGWRDFGAAASCVWRTRRDSTRRRPAAATDEEVPPVLWVTLLRKLLLLTSMRRFLRGQSSLRLVTADFDRGDLSSVWCSAARSEGITSASIQHGVIFPSADSVGWGPLVADAIFVWGSAAREHLLAAEGVAADAIFVVGNPSRLPEDDCAVEATEPGTARRPSRSLVVLALSSPDELKDRRVVGFFASLREHQDMQAYRFAVKLHPARDPADFCWVQDEFHVELLPPDTSRQELVDASAAVLVTSTTLGVEMLAQDVPLGVIDLPEVPIGFGQGYVDYLGVPRIEEPSDLVNLVAGSYAIDMPAVLGVVGEPVGSRCADAMVALTSGEGVP